MNSNRTFYYNIDQTNRRVYLYVYVTGGNAYGKWNTSVLQSHGGSWIPEFAGNQPNQSSFVTINEIIVETATDADTVDGYHANAFVKKSGDTMTGALNLANGTWNKAGDDSQFGDNNTAGSFAIQGINGNTNLKMVTYGNTSYGTITWNGSQFVFSHGISGTFNGNATTATTASKLSRNAGSATKPIYFSGGVPVQCNDTLGVNISGNAATATKLQTTRNIILNGNLQGSASFNGTGDATITALNYQSSINGGNTCNYPWHRIATTVVGTGQSNDRSALLRIRHTFHSGGEGLVKVSVRTNSAGSDCDISAIWLYRYNIAANDIGIGLWGVTGDNVYLDVYYKCTGGWPRAIVESISNGRIFTLISSNEASDTTITDKKTSSEVYTSIENGATLIHGKAYTKIVYGSDGTDNGRYVLKSGDTMTGNLTAPSIYTSNWFRSTGATG